MSENNELLLPFLISLLIFTDFEEEPDIESDKISLFEGDFSDNDPSYYPELPSAPRCDSSDDSDLITLEELENPDLVYQAQKNKREQQRKGIELVFGNKQVSHQVAELIMLELVQRCWKVIKPRSRWRLSDPTNWKINIAKKRRAEGLTYMTAKKIRVPKVPKLVDCSKCQYKCKDNISESERETICRQYWSLDYVARKTFLLHRVEAKTTKTLLKNRKRSTERSFAKKCFFEIGGERKYVCSKFFCRSLCISPSVVNDAIKQKDTFGSYSVTQDPRGRKEPPNKISSEKLQAIKSHIASFPTMESHYIRKQSKRKYLDAGLSLCKMYSCYVEYCKKNNFTPVSETSYRRVFATEFNLSFFVPKKDQCPLCTKYNQGDPEQKSKINKEYTEHIERKKICNTEKAKDKERSEKEPNFLSATFDLQAILQIPSTEVGILYYTRKLTVYNLTIYESALPNEAYCFVWTEANGKKGSAEIGTILAHYLRECIPENVTEVSLFSDTCGGQNRNQFIAALLLWVVNHKENLQIIEHKFLESGHSYMEVDSMHSSIESAKKHRDVYCLQDWINIFKDARSKETYVKGTKKVKKNRYNVTQFKYADFKDLKQLANTVILNRTTNTEGQKVQWLKIKRMRYIKGDLKIYYNYDMSENFKQIDVTCSEKPSKTTPAVTTPGNHGYSTRRKSKLPEAEIPATEVCEVFSSPPLQQLYKNPLPVSIAKKKDLLNLCKKGIIPDEYHGWFESLVTDSETVDRVPDASKSDEDSDESYHDE